MPGVLVVFPGQGSQKQGMAEDFCHRHPESRAVFAEASDALGLDLFALCTQDDPRLHLTAFTQPAILTAEMAMVRALQAHHGLAPAWFAGHSLGEYTALCAAGVIPLAEAVRLVHERGRRMQEAVPEGEGAMTAVMGTPVRPEDLVPHLEGLAVDVANHNAPDQVVLSGRAADMDEAERRVQAALPLAKLRRLNVSAPFHSRLMEPVALPFRQSLEASLPSWNPARAGLVASNTTGGLHRPDGAAIVDLLTRQIAGTVRWVDNMHTLVGLGPARILEIGPNRPLRGFFHALGVEVEPIFNLLTAERVLGST